MLKKLKAGVPGTFIMLYSTHVCTFFRQYAIFSARMLNVVGLSGIVVSYPDHENP